MSELCELGLVGLAVMGENLALNVANHGFRVAVTNRTTSKVDQFISGRAAGKPIVGCQSLAELVSRLTSPRKVMLMVKAGPAVDTLIESLLGLLSPGDVIIDGGNTHFAETERRTRHVEERGLLYVGT
ncbi:MAG: NAD(P)-binding domain-containing protein, partial [Pirellulales bacterium]